MDNGIVIYAFKKPSYGKLAFNLAISLKYHSPDIPICLIHDEEAIRHLADKLKIFDVLIKIAHDDLYDGMKFTPGKAKLSGYKYFPFERNMIIDADSLCIRPVEPLFEKCGTKSIYAQTVWVGDQQATEWTCTWMSLEACKQAFVLPKAFQLFEINSSFFYVKKGKEAEAFYKQALSNYKPDHPKLRKWGGGFPDELAFNIAFAQTGVNPAFDDLKKEDINNIAPIPVYFSRSSPLKNVAQRTDLFFIGMYGGRNFTSKGLQAQYDAFMREYSRKFEFVHQWKGHLLMRDKHHQK